MKFQSGRKNMKDKKIVFCCGLDFISCFLKHGETWILLFHKLMK